MRPKRGSPKGLPPGADSKTPTQRTGRAPARAAGQPPAPRGGAHPLPPTGATPRELLGRAREASTADQVRQMASQLPPAQPGARTGSGDTQSDYSVTAKIERLPSEITPAPLPPSPAAAEADVWFDQVPTNPAATPDLDALVGSRPDLAAAMREQTGRQSRVESRPGLDPWAPPSYGTGSMPRQVPLHRQPWVLPVLLTLTALAVGMVLGALLFGGPGGAGETDRAGAADCAECDCAEPQ